MMLDESVRRSQSLRQPFVSSSTSSFNGTSYSTPSSSSNSDLSRSSKISRFMPSSFSENPRFAIALLPSAAFLLDLGGTAVVGTLTVGLMISYILDSLQLKSASFFSIWFSLLAAQIAFFFTATSSIFSSFSIPLALLATFLCAQSNFLIGVWISLQFRWIQMENPSIVLALERLLFACVPISASAIFTWATVSATGINNAAYYLMVFLCVFYWMFSLPRVSSFKSMRDSGFHGGEISEDAMILGSLESCIHSLYLMFLPVIFRIGTHHSVIFFSASSVCDLLLLFFIPFLFQLYASTRGALWWITKNSNQLQSIRVVNGAVAVFIVVICLEIRVIFHSFGRYLQVPPPLNYLLVTVAMLGGASAVGAFAVGLVGDAFSSALFTTMSVVVSVAGAIVVGFPIWLFPLPIISGYYLARFFLKKSLPAYFTFVLLSSLMVVWFVVHNFWDLNIWLAGMTLKSFCKLIVASVLLAMAVPGLALLPPKFRLFTEVGLVAHTLLLCYIEDRFFNYSSIYYFGFEDEVLYPSYMVITTTFLGLALVRRLVVDHRVGSKTVWILTCLYISKLTMLFMTSKTILWVSAILLLAVSPPLLLYKERFKGASKMKVWQGFMHAGVVALSAWLCRETIFEVLQWWHGKPPSDGLLVGFYLLITGLACIPIVALHFPLAQLAKRALVIVVAAGLLFILMQPPIPFSWAFKSDLISAARQSSDDISIYGFITSKPTWPSWLLIVTVLLTLAAITSIIPINHIVELRAFYSVGVGISLGIYICAEYFLQATILHILLVASVICCTVFMVFTRLPSASSPKVLPWVFALLVALFPVTYLLEGQLRVKNIYEEEGDKLTMLLAVEGARTSLLGLYATMFMLIALELKFELASLIHDKAIDRGVGSSHSNRASNFAPKMRLIQQRRASVAPTFTVKRLALEAAWMPAVGNVATFLCFIICLILNGVLTGSSNRSIFFLAPILLLLNQDSDFVSGFGDRQRYFPVAVVVSIYLISNTFYRIWEHLWLGNSGWGLEIGGPGWVFAIKNLALLILTLPNHILFNKFMWNYAKQTDLILLLTVPLNLPCIIITDIISVKVLGLLGVIYALTQYLISRQTRIAGMKYI